MSINKAVVTAAGLGTRLLQLTESRSKVMLPLGNRPVIDHILEEIRAAGIEKTIIISRSEYGELSDHLKDRKNITIVLDDTLSGPGGALLHTKELMGNEPFFVLFGDAPLRGEPRLITAHWTQMQHMLNKEKADAVISVYKIPAEEVASRGIVLFEEKINNKSKGVIVGQFLEKPSLTGDYMEYYWASTCRYLVKPTIFEALKSAESDQTDEIQLTAAIQQLVNKGDNVVALPIPEGLKRFDTGNIEGYQKAVTAYADEEKGEN